MRIAVPLISWLICIPFSLLFAFSWGMSAFSPSPASMLKASSYLWVAVPVLAVGAILLFLQFKRLTWLSFLLHVLPWNAFPWLAIAFLVSGGDRGPWIELGKLLNVPTIVCFALAAVRALPLPSQVQPGLQIVGIGTVVAICSITWYEYSIRSDAYRKAVEQAQRAKPEVYCDGHSRIFESLPTAPPDPTKGSQTEAEWHHMGAVPKYDKHSGELVELYFFGPGKTYPPHGTQALRHVQFLTHLRLAGLWATDEDLQYITHLRGLKYLDLLHTSVTEAGLHQLINLDDLEALHISDCAITNKSLDILPPMFPKLRSLAVYGTLMTAEGIRSFETKQKKAGRPIHVAH